MHQDLEGPWRDFADADAQVHAPPRLRLAVMDAWDAAHGVGVPPRSQRRRLVAVGAIAATIVVAAAVVLRDRLQQPALQPDRVESERLRAPEATPGALTAPVVRLVADAMLENEPLQIVRVRLPLTSLEALGITLFDTGASSLVDVDVLVGSDGLPRAIQQVTPALDVDRQP
jgi:hypothetical protein